ncbi:acyltransferase [Desulfobacter postgatei]|uniref:acyltransferase n=1 Tax=Desulfobacter postgatei TaxID=2293 RepID=UPI00259B7BCB|nr:acyltransferase [uncultured Desulfobacter sp.]
MRTIRLNAILLFLLLFSVSLTGSCLVCYTLYYHLTINFLLVFICGILFLYLFAIFFHRLFLRFFPLTEGYIEPGSSQELIYHVYLLCYLFLFYQLIRPKIIPVPLLKIVYLLLGAKLGKNTFCSGTILDPIFTVAGDNTIIGEDSCLFAHTIEGSHLSHKKIILGNNVTIGAKSIIMAGAKIADNAIVAAGSVVSKNTMIRENEIWGGNPAKFIKKAKEDLAV